MKNIFDIEFIHLGSNMPMTIPAIKNDPVNNKPRGCLWASSYELDNEGLRSDWERLCDWEDFRSYHKNQYFKFKLIPEAKVLVVDSKNDYLNIDEKYFVGPNDSATSMSIDDLCYNYHHMLTIFNKKYLDFEKISKHYDAFYLTKKAANELHFCFDIEEKDFNSWDVESLCVFNNKCFEVTEFGEGGYNDDDK
jgi:hypothetical protein